MRSVLLAIALAVGCSAGTGKLKETKLPPDKVRDNEEVSPKGPDYPPQPGVKELGSAALRCYNRALTHNPIFRRGGVLVVRWKADANGDLLSLDFIRDSFADWEIDGTGQTLASCIAKRVESSTVRWSRTGTAPLRFSGDPAASQPASQPGQPGR
jgi:hypothetical protein